MKIAYFDCFAGISGDMVLGALVDAGLRIDDLRAEVDKLHLPGIGLRAEKACRRAISGTQVTVTAGESGTERHLREIHGIIEASGLSETAKATSLKIFRDLAEVEAGIHGLSVDEVHFHELGGIDSIVDVVGAVAGLERLGVARIYASKINTGSGQVECRHGILPVPAPATAELLKGIPVYSSGLEAELTTPTGAALIKHLASGFGPLPDMVVRAIGYGAGSRDLAVPNLLRLAIGDAAEGIFDGPGDRVMLLETNIDDMNPEWFEPASAALFEAGALDVFITPIQMKKSRPALALSVIVAEERLAAMAEILFRETTTFGVRWHETRRLLLERETITVATRFGPLAVKLGKRSGVIVAVAPEYEDCRRVAREQGVALKTVYAAAQTAAESQLAGR